MANKILNDDPEYLKSLIGRHVSISTVDNNLHEGVIYVIDPVKKSIILYRSESLKIILYHAIKKFEVLSSEVDENFLIKSSHESKIHRQEDELQKNRIMKWLKQQLLDVEEEGNDLKINEHLLICAPYKKENCICDNTIILERIWNAIDEMPANFE